MVSFCELLKAVNLEFPRELSLKDGEKLVRSILYIPPEGGEIDSISDAVNFNEGGGYAERMLNEMLHLLDDNLGKKYRRVSFELYGNKRGWRRNKWDEMLTPGLCYVYYCRNCNLQTHTRVDSPLQIQLFLSFMHTELDQVQSRSQSQLQPQRLPVLYLYELQLCPTVRSQGLGTFLLNTCLRCCCQRLAPHERNGRNDIKGSRRQDAPRGIALTVFGDNKPALRLYRDKLHMKIVDSRQTTGSHRILRSSRNSRNVSDSTGNVYHQGNAMTKGKGSGGGGGDLQETTATVKNPPLYFVLLMPVSAELSTSSGFP